MLTICSTAGSKTDIAYRISGRIPPNEVIENAGPCTRSVTGGAEIKSEEQVNSEKKSRISELKKLSSKQLRTKSSNIGKHYGMYMYFHIL